ncbi:MULTISPECIES: DUF2306 domain-containing protein [unclassified Rhizobium]|uniref:DUF2306 domain-containing protein n=1 Tax=unclassified Rhizobium TaxID=2613769 RepID=UPI000EA8EE1C|nr:MULTISPECIES: DUF2306 domain-containing protein [unclassified Rhizobium]AYG68236.1 DUF2306 domain-containing protein [Rhizobium sp. CCGE531]AYG74619.1 DUF2306 domain-containing protein [Rhizobium sp. CCGE532]
MTLEPLLNASIAIHVHVAAVIPAALLGAYLLLRPKGTPMHRLFGKIWLVLMVITALSSFFIHQINMFYGFSPIHLLSIYVLFGCWGAIANARKHNIEAHKRIVRGLYFGGIVGAGAFTLIPGRIMNKVAFDGDEIAPLLVAAGIGIALLWLMSKEMWRRRRLT